MDGWNLAKYEIELPFGKIEAHSFVELKQLVLVEHEFWSKFELDHFLRGRRHQGLWNRLQGQREVINSVFSFWDEPLKFLENQDGRTIKNFFPEFIAPIESSILRPPYSNSAFCRALERDYENNNHENAAALLVGYLLSIEPTTLSNLHAHAEEGVFFGLAKGYFASVSAADVITPQSVASRQIEKQIGRTDDALKDLFIATDDILNQKNNALDEIATAKNIVKSRWKKLHLGILSRAKSRRLSVEAEEQRRTVEFSELLEAFNAHMRLSRPVDLWSTLQTEHRESSRTAWVVFIVGSVAFGIASLLIVLLLGNEIANAFVPAKCVIGTEQICDRISAKGPLIVSAILAVSTVWLWFLRLQMKVHLSERHLFLDARERKAFAETYLSLLKGGQVSTDHEAVVLQSLFRPTQDGIIKDDGGVDVGLAGLLSKMLTK